jgi:hypothetical protein
MRRKSILLSALTAVTVGVGGLMLANAGPASAAAAGLFKVTCGYSHTNTDDMIVYPGRPGVSHSHDYYGNAGTNAGSTYKSLDGVRSTCATDDRAAYWTPTVYQNGNKLTPTRMVAYYTTPVDPKVTRIEPFPADFRMIIGDPKNTSEAGMGRINWGCGDDQQISHKVPTRCAVDNIQVRITFPSCWNGVRSAGNSTPNLRFPGGGKCPKGFNHPFPTVRVNVNYRTGTNVGKITLSSGSYTTAHADFVNAWDQKKLTDLVNKCLNGAQNCGRFMGTSPGRAP